MCLERDKPEHQEVKGIHYFRSINLWVSFPATLPFQVLTLIGVAWAGGNNRDGLCSQVKKTLPQLCVMDMSDQAEITREIQVRLMDQGFAHDHFEIRSRYDPGKPDRYQKPTSACNKEIPMQVISYEALQPNRDDGVQYLSSDGQLFLQFEVGE